ncbi:septal ring lytic transglycosylase RlpA family protein [Vitiosangium sp. GDMCC 1.1324]|uniref:septal ring lytic transglycosylase RlpA family protein n=1 Tax=Vitiosangium sp. (strain GDMCC 1.1324) TaxID=2138576 RepID=UPI001E343B3C|nr:septal ring lytic transglycosylase RlpA family protein [Vitiosangium sp. GDMCC 1.1324]
MVNFHRSIKAGSMLPRNHSRLFLRAACAFLFLTSACDPASGSPDGQDDATETSSSALLFSGVSFKTVLGNRYVGAQNNGGGAVIATATSAQAWEKFTIDDINGGALESGDSIFIIAGTGQYFQAANGGGSTLNAASSNRLGWETFRIVKQNGSGVIANGDVVGLQTVTTGNWVSAENGGGGPVFAYGGALGSWEQFTISGLSQSGGGGPISTCNATWYGAEGEIPQGWPTASGEGFDRWALKAAHNSLPFGTKVKVTYQGKSVTVTINDRGSFGLPVCLDLTYGAFVQIANPDLGNIVVQYQVL